MTERSSSSFPESFCRAMLLAGQIYRWWRLHPRQRLSKARAHRSRLRHLPWRWIETMTSPAILSDPFRAGSGNGALNGYQPKSDRPCAMF